ncbi:hypothetical protein D3C73_1150210 [compost metagenome]
MAGRLLRPPLGLTDIEPLDRHHLFERDAGYLAGRHLVDLAVGVEHVDPPLAAGHTGGDYGLDGREVTAHELVAFFGDEQAAQAAGQQLDRVTPYLHHRLKRLGLDVAQSPLDGLDGPVAVYLPVVCPTLRAECAVAQGAVRAVLADDAPAAPTGL